MSAIDQLFQKLRADKKKAFMPFVTAGDPNIDFTAKLLRVLDSVGVSMCEVGIPYSDPIADGPVIQASYTRALARHTKLADIFHMLATTTPNLSIPVVTMVSYAIVHRHGPESYVREARAAGVAGAIVPDLPVEESEGLSRICRQHDFSLIQLVTPTTPRERAMQIAATSTGFLYYVSVTGITGERTELPKELLDNVAWLRARTELPVCIGFGISQPEHVKLLGPAADGLIVGSAFVRRVEQAVSQDEASVLEEIRQYASHMLDAIASV